MALIKCPECQNEISDNAKICPKCGYAFQKFKFCKFCGEKIPEDSVVCTKCGRQVETTNQTAGGVTINNVSSSSSSSSASASAAAQATSVPEIGPKRKIDKNVALILCIFLGWLGVHKFYEGKIGLGVLYACTMGLFSIGWIIDIILIALKPNPYYV